jgi:hypothetical protein
LILRRPSGVAVFRCASKSLSVGAVGFPSYIGGGMVRFMATGTTQDQGLDTVLAQLRVLNGVDYEDLEDGRIGLKIFYNGSSAEVFIATAADDYRSKKIRYGQLEKMLTGLGVKEGQTFLPAKPSGRTMTPQMHAARANQKREFEAWQAVWQTLRRAEKALDVAYEIAQMKDYY